MLTSVRRAKPPGPKRTTAAVVRNAASSYGLQAVRAASALILTPYLYRRLGPAGFGTWSVMFTVTTVFGLLELGFSAGVRKLVAELRAQHRRTELESMLGAAVVLMAGLGILAAALSAGLALVAPDLAARADQHGFAVGMLVLGAAMLLRFPCVAYGAALVGYQRWELFNAAQAVAVGGFTVAAIVAIETGTGILGLSVAYAATYAISGALFGLLLTRTDRDLSLRPRLADRETRRRLGSFGSLTLLADSMVFIGQRMDAIVIAALRSAREAGPFAAASRVVGGLQSLTLPFVFLMMPMVSELWATGRRAEVLRRLTLATRVVLQLTLPVAVALAVFASDVVHVVLGPSAPPVTVSIIVLLMGVQCLTLAAFPAEQVLVGIGRVRWVGGLALLEGFSNLALSVVLVSAYGAIGAALGTLFTSALLAPIKWPMAMRATGGSLRGFARTAIGVAVVSSVPGVVVMVALRAVLPAGAGRLVIGTVAGLVVCAVIAAVQARAGSRVRTLWRARRDDGELGRGIDRELLAESVR